MRDQRQLIPGGVFFDRGKVKMEEMYFSVCELHAGEVAKGGRKSRRFYDHCGL